MEMRAGEECAVVRTGEPNAEEVESAGRTTDGRTRRVVEMKAMVKSWLRLVGRAGAINESFNEVNRAQRLNK